MEGLFVTPEMVNEYLESRAKAGLSADTISSYRRKLEQMYEMLPEDKTIVKGMIKEMGQKQLEQGYSIQGANVFLSAANNFVDHFERHDLRSGGRIELEEVILELAGLADHYIRAARAS